MPAKKSRPRMHPFFSKNVDLQGVPMNIPDDQATLKIEPINGLASRAPSESNRRHLLLLRNFAALAADMEKPRQQLIFRNYTLVVERLVLAGEIENRSERRTEIENILARAVATLVEPARTEFAPTAYPPGAERPKFVHRPPRADGTKETALEFFNRVWALDAKSGKLTAPMLRKSDNALYAQLSRQRDAEGRTLLSTVVALSKPGPKAKDENPEDRLQRRATQARVARWKKGAHPIG